ncbi:hypothetical protein LPJ75_002199 [Coemansia sp. RSA 2598]|nr:hypothetical protein LPJ75_002199 [Coemansia sp. RSA 2598]
MSHTNSSHSTAHSPSTAESPSSAETPNSNSAGPSLGPQNHQQQYAYHIPATTNGHSLQHQQSYSDAPASSQSSYVQLPPTSSLQPQSGYPSAFSSTASATSPQLHQQPAHSANGLLYQNSSHNHNPSAQYVSQDQQTALAPLQFGSLGVIGQQRPASSFSYDFDPNDANCRNMYAAADMDPSHHVPQQLTTSGYIRHGGGILVSAAQPPSALSSMHTQQQQQQQQQSSLDMTAAAAAAANISLPVDINGGDHSAQAQQQAQHQQPQQQQQHHLQHPGQAASTMHASNPQSPFGSSPVGNQPIFTTLSFQNSQLQEYDPYARPAKRSGRTTKPKRTPRPPNAFILYRKAKQAEVIRDNPGVSNKDVSCIIGQMWKSEDPAVQDQFREQAEVEKKKHKEMHPNYKYQPRKPKNKRLQESQAAGASAVNNALVAGGSQDGSFASTGLSMSNANSVLSSALKDSSASASANAPFQSYSKYHLMMQSGQAQQQQQQQAMQIQHPQTPVSQQQQQTQQAQLGRGDEYYYRGAGAMAESQQHMGNGFVGVAPQIDIKSGSFVGGIPASAYWTPTTPSDAAFSNTLPSANVFHGNGGDQTAHMRSFDSSVAQHSAAGHTMGASPAQLFHPFDHQRQSQQQQQQHHHHQQQQQQIHDGQSHMDYQTGQQQQFHQHHGHSQQQQQQQGPHAALGGYVNGGQAYHHSQAGMEGLDSTSVAAADSQGLGLLSPPTVAWSTNM